MTLFDLSQFKSVDETIESVSSRGPRAYATQMIKTDEGLAAVWEGDQTTIHTLAKVLVSIDSNDRICLEISTEL